MAIYIPLFLYQQGNSFEKIGIGLSIVMIPFVILEYPVGKIADRFGHEKWFFAIGFALISLSLSLIALNNHFWTIVAWYLLGSCGGALIESLNTSMFLKQVRHHKTAMIGIFNTANVLGWMAGMFFASFMLLFFDLASLFRLIIPFTLIGLWISIQQSSPSNH
jgi:MFS family permease